MTSLVKTYAVEARFKTPSSNTGYDMVVHAKTKRAAIKTAREIVSEKGHWTDGPLTFNATRLSGHQYTDNLS